MSSRHSTAIIAGIGILVGSAWIAGPAEAALVKLVVPGVVTTATAPNPFGLAVGDGVQATATFDQALVDSGNPNQELDLRPVGGTLKIVIGSFTYDETKETGPNNFPKLFFANGAIDGISFTINPLTFGGLSNLRLQDFNVAHTFFVDQLDQLGAITSTPLGATWQFDKAQTTVLPIPGGFALLVPGLVALGLGARRARAA